MRKSIVVFAAIAAGALASAGCRSDNDTNRALGTERDPQGAQPGQLEPVAPPVAPPIVPGADVEGQQGTGHRGQQGQGEGNQGQQGVGQGPQGIEGETGRNRGGIQGGALGEGGSGAMRQGSPGVGDVDRPGTGDRPGIGERPGEGSQDRPGRPGATDRLGDDVGGTP